MLASFALQCLSSLLFRVYLLLLNNRKALTEQQEIPTWLDDQEDSSAVHAFADLTDKQVCFISLSFPFPSFESPWLIVAELLV